MRPDLLFLAHRVPHPPDKGDRIRTFHILRNLARRFRVHLACLADEPVSEQSQATLQRLCAQVSIVPVGNWLRWPRALFSMALGGTASEGVFASRTLRTVVRTWASETRFQAALASSSSLASYLRLPELGEACRVVDLIDVDSQKWLDYSALSRFPKSWLYRLEGKRLRRLESGLARWAHALTVVSQAEADLYRECCGNGPIVAVGNGVDLDYFTPAPQSLEPRCVFVGALDYRPNVEGAIWFCREVWPEIHRLCPDAHLALVGRKPVVAVQCLGSIAGVQVVGQVPDVRPYLARAAIAVAPLHIARGIQNKVLEAMAMERATVATPQALEGLQASAGREAISALRREDWIKAIVGLLNDPPARKELGEAGRRYVEKHHSWERCLAPMESLLDRSHSRQPYVNTAASGDVNAVSTAVDSTWS